MPSQAFWILDSFGKFHLFPGEPYFFEGLSRKNKEIQRNKTKKPPHPYNVQVA